MLQWFVDFLTEIIEGGAMPNLVDARVYFTDSEKPPDDLAALMLNLGLAMSQSQPKPQLRRKVSTGSSIKSISVDGVPDFEYILQGKISHTIYIHCVNSEAFVFHRNSGTEFSMGGRRVFTRKSSCNLAEGSQEHLQFTITISSVNI